MVFLSKVIKLGTSDDVAMKYVQKKDKKSIDTCHLF
jgi:hypothetical protein